MNVDTLLCVCKFFKTLKLFIMRRLIFEVIMQFVAVYSIAFYIKSQVGEFDFGWGFQLLNSLIAGFRILDWIGTNYFKSLD